MRKRFFCFSTYSSRRSLTTVVWVGITLICTGLLAQPTLAVDWSACRTENGTTSIPVSSSSTTVTLTTAITDTAQAFLLLDATGTSAISGGDDHLVNGYISNASSLVFARTTATGTAAQVSYTVVECFDNEFSVQRGEVAIASGTASNTATITAVNTGRSMVLVSTRSSDTTDTENNGMVLGSLSDTTTVLVERATSPAITATVRYEVVEFSLVSSVSVQTGEIALGLGDSSQTAAISSVATGRAWVYCSWGALTDGLQQTAVGCELTDATTVTAYRHNASAYSNRVRYFVVEFPVGAVTVQRGSVSNHPGSTDGTEYNHDITITAVTAVTKAFPYVTNTTRGTGSEYPRNQWLAYFTSTTNLRTAFWRGIDALLTADNVKYWQVIEFPMAVPSTPSITSAEDQDRNPDLVASTYAGQGTHLTTDWKVIPSTEFSSGCTSAVGVWRSLSNSTNLTSITVNSTTGNFIGEFLGQTQLAQDAVYYACVRYTNGGGNSEWSTATIFRTNVPPTASAASIDSGASSINLITNSTQTVTGTATVTDTDSCQDIQSVTARLYRTSVGSSGSADNNTRYLATCTQTSGTCTGSSDTSADYSCVFTVQYYADPTDAGSPNATDNWTMQVTPADEIGDGTSTTATIEMNSLVALSVAGSINFGTLNLGDSTGSNNQTVTITNAGNIPIDFSLATFGSAAGDDKAMACTTGSIPATALKYSLAAFNYATGGVSGSSTATEVDLDLPKSTGTASTAQVYLGLQIPSSGVSGSCSGYTRITAVSDPTSD